MKKTHLFICILLVATNALLAQKLSISELISICNQPTYERAENILIQKGWVFYETKSGNYFDGSYYRMTVWSYKRDHYDTDKAHGWINLYTYDNHPCVLEYQMCDDKYYPIMRNQLAGAGFTSKGTSYDADGAILKYASSTYSLEIYNRTTDNYFNRYNFKLLRKNSQADECNGKKEESFWSGKIEYTLVDCEKHGTEKVYYPNGKIKHIATYVHGEKNGPYKKYDENGYLTADGTMKDDDFTGKIKKYNDDGQIIMDGSLAAKGFTGWIKAFDDDGTLIGLIQLKDDEWHGLLKAYYPDGSLKKTFTAVYGHINGPMKEWNENGELTFDGTAVEAHNEEDEEDRELLYTGTHWLYDNDGVLQKKTTLLKGEKHGECLIYDKGKLYRIETYEHGELVGPYKEYSENGQLKEEGTISNGELSGEYKEYYENGQMMNYCEFVDGKSEGKFKMWRKDGRIIKDGLMRDDKFTGTEWVYADDLMDTVAYAILNYENDMFHGHVTFIDKDEKTKAEGDFTHGTGELITKDSLNRITIAQQFENNLPNGDKTSYKYDSDGSLYEIGITEYKDGEETGNYRWYMRDTLVEVSNNGSLMRLYLCDDSLPTSLYAKKKWEKTQETHLLHNLFRHGSSWTRISVEDGFDYVVSEYKYDVLDGEYKVYHSDIDDFNSAKLECRFSYVKGKPHGDYYCYDENDVSYIERKFNHGELIYFATSVSEFFFAPDLNFIKFERLSTEHDHWKMTTVYEDSIVSREIYQPIEDEDKGGISLKFHSDYAEDTYNVGTLILSACIIPGRHTDDGIYECIYNDGSLNITGTYSRNVKVGYWTTNYNTQKLKQVVYYDKGEVNEEKFYTSGDELFSGDWMWEDNETRTICPIKNGSRNGTAKTYDKQTLKLLYKEKYKKGIKIQ